MGVLDHGRDETPGSVGDTADLGREQKHKGDLVLSWRCGADRAAPALLQPGAVGRWAQPGTAVMVRTFLLPAQASFLIHLVDHSNKGSVHQEILFIWFTKFAYLSKRRGKLSVCAIL